MDGNGDILSALGRLEAGQRRLEEAQQRLEAAQQRTARELVEFRTEVRGEFSELRTDMNERFDHAFKFLGAQHADHEQRITALEDDPNRSND